VQSSPASPFMLKTAHEMNALAVAVAGRGHMGQIPFTNSSTWVTFKLGQGFSPLSACILSGNLPECSRAVVCGDRISD